MNRPELKLQVGVQKLNIKVIPLKKKRTIHKNDCLKEVRLFDLVSLILALGLSFGNNTI